MPLLKQGSCMAILNRTRELARWFKRTKDGSDFLAKLQAGLSMLVWVENRQG